jgi:hypothetical protein
MVRRYSANASMIYNLLKNRRHPVKNNWPIFWSTHVGKAAHLDFHVFGLNFFRFDGLEDDGNLKLVA